MRYSEGAGLYARGAVELREKQGGAFGLPTSFRGRDIATCDGWGEIKWLENHD
jgi:hypothetical protein